jgi:dTDP-4-amino-4,6-dideoxygalactose transaminase
MSEFGAGDGSMPAREQTAGEILSLPIYPGITVEQQERVAAVLRSALGAGSD